MPVFDEFHILEEVGAIMEQVDRFSTTVSATNSLISFFQGVQELDAQQTFITIPFKLLFANR